MSNRIVKVTVELPSDYHEKLGRWSASEGRSKRKQISHLVIETLDELDDAQLGRQVRPRNGRRKGEVAA
jgi:hypothetical protein